MLQLGSTDAVVAGIARGREICAEAYMLQGPVLRALEAAARNGAGVSVRLEGAPFDDPTGYVAKGNAKAVAELCSAGAVATLAHPLHAKALTIDGVLYLDEKNWRRGDLVLRESDAEGARNVATIKHEALDREAELLNANAGDAIVESESFGCCNAVYGALLRLALEGASPRLLVADRELRGNVRESGLLAALVRDGVRVRVCRDSEKLAACGDGAWLGSANATAAFGEGDMIDWGVSTRDPAIVSAVRARFEKTWRSAAEFRYRKA